MKRIITISILCLAVAGCVLTIVAQAHNALQTVPVTVDVSKDGVLKLSAETTSTAQLSERIPPIIGHYHGLCDGRDIWTDLSVDDGGQLVGKYHQKTDGGYQGTLSDCEMLNNRAFLFTWHDKYGVGSLKVLFDKNYSGFEGRWNTRNSGGGDLSWSGVRD